MIQTLIGMTGLILGALIGFFVGRAWARAQGGDAAARGQVEFLREQNADLHHRARRDGDVLAALLPVQEKLTEVQRQVQQMEADRAQQYGALTAQLRQTAQTEEFLRKQTADLATALHTPGHRGAWGELTLRRVLEASGLTRYTDFEEQKTLSLPGGAERRLRPDVIVRLPGGGSLAIDAKVPLDSFMRATGGSQDPGGRDPKESLQQHARAVRAHVDTLASRDYATALQVSPEFVIMFLPAEPLLIEALRWDQGLLEHALAKGVVLATPANLLAILKTVAVIWQQHTIEAQASKLLEVGKQLYQSLGVLGGHITKLGSALESAVKGYNALVNSLENRLVPRLRKLDGFDTSKLNLTEIDGDKVHVQPLRRPELTAEPPRWSPG
ncbi:MAG: DNA recombination protein RmuC [Bifidobacteriaceae bacterium]|jgi:DNA recombination protein RmuC|nr:DNA recombination protein RmuC [Bifidobacteriaceae bacterium]